MKVKNLVIKIVLNDDITAAQAEEMSDVIAVLLDFAGYGYAIFTETEEEEVEDGEEK